MDEWKIDALARIFVAGVRDIADVDELAILVETVRQLEAPHLRVLRIVSRPGPQVTGRMHGGVEKELRLWRDSDILAVDPGGAGPSTR